MTCSHLHKGRFFMTGPSGGEIKIKRRKKVQVERYNREHQKYKFTVIWTSDCSYTLILRKVKGKKTAKEYVGSKVHTNIISAKKDHYTALSKTENGIVSTIEITKK